ncbi:MAG: arginine repressor [Chlorobiaceae bacterium]|jgi:transcriptional regulator of arginine metabolism|nr:arginine repressor [Chlorobiaceae bacterium]NTV15871.1 arginine repressor [Chlorobiaceae bacterium]
MNKHARQLKIREILQQNSVSNQHDLLQLLRDSGMAVAQATLSRDCAELGIIRTRSNGIYKMLCPDDDADKIIKGLVGIEVLSINSNESCVIIMTLPGRAHGVGSWLDQKKSPLILGTIAGDDTVLVIPTSILNISALKSYIHKNLSKK